MSEEELWDETYGTFPGGDPRLFNPDEECCTPDEIARWKQACAAWDAGEGVDTGPECLTLGNGAAILGTGFGVGVYRWPLTKEEFSFIYGPEGAEA